MVHLLPGTMVHFSYHGALDTPYHNAPESPWCRTDHHVGWPLTTHFPERLVTSGPRTMRSGALHTYCLHHGASWCTLDHGVQAGRYRSMVHGGAPWCVWCTMVHARHLGKSRFYQDIPHGGRGCCIEDPLLHSSWIRLKKKVNA